LRHGHRRREEPGEDAEEAKEAKERYGVKRTVRGASLRSNHGVPDRERFEIKEASLSP
jgi:hypothetical protein